MKPDLLHLAASSPWLSARLEERFNVRRVFDVEAPEAVIDAHGASIRAVMTTGSRGIDNSLIDRLPGLEIVAVDGVGVDAIDLTYAKHRGVVVANTPDVLTDDVADLAIALTLAAFRRLVVNDGWVRSGRWEAGEKPPLARRFTGSAVGVLGLGRIGLAVGRRLEGFTDRIAYHSRRPVEGVRYSYCDSPRALAQACDVLIVTVPGGRATEGLVDAAVLDALGPEGLLINVARGSVVDETALVAALTEGRLAGAGLDVFADEPRTPHALWSLETVVLQPHQGSATTETRGDMARLVLANLDAHFAGRPLPTPVPVPG